MFIVQPLRADYDVSISSRLRDVTPPLATGSTGALASPSLLSIPMASENPCVIRISVPPGNAIYVSSKRFR